VFRCSALLKAVRADCLLTTWAIVKGMMAQAKRDNLLLSFGDIFLGLRGTCRRLRSAGRR
jgi:hypothetical protein